MICKKNSRPRYGPYRKRNRLALDEKDVINQVGEYGEAWRIEEEDGKCKLIRFKWNYEEDCTPTDWKLESELEF